MRARRGFSLVALALVLVVGTTRVEAGPEATTWKAPDRITQLKRADVDGDGTIDVLLASGRTVHVYTAKGDDPTRADHVVTLDERASFADVAPEAGALRVLAAGRRYLVSLADGTRRAEQTLPEGVLDWRDRDTVTFLDLAHPSGTLLPTTNGWSLERRDGTRVSIELAPDRAVTPAGPFLEDTATATVALPAVHVGRSALDGPKRESALWAFSGTALVARHGTHEVRYDVGFLPREGDRRLVDLDADGRPDVMHRKTTNRDGQYAFFRTPAVERLGAAPPRLTPARSILRLSGFQLEPDLVDLDGDGRLDLVVTTIEIDPKNTLRALTSGAVTAQTRAFLNRTQAAAEGMFEATADASILSDVGVKLRFTYAGTIEVKRSLTIVVDGDYDGDGRKDLLIRTGPETLRIRRGRAAGVWEPEGVDVAIPPVGDHTNIEAYAADTDGDGKDELLLVYRAEAPAAESVVHLETGL